jgi:hypothetical protein
VSPAKLIKGLRTRFPTFIIAEEDDLIRVEVPEFRTIWIKFTLARDSILFATAPRGFGAYTLYDRRTPVPCDCPISIDHRLWCVACDIGTVRSPDDLRRFIGGPFDAVVRNVAHTHVRGIQYSVDRDRARIAEDLALIQARADRESEAADLKMKTALPWLEIVEHKP